jgi:hypothetical protein
VEEHPPKKCKVLSSIKRKEVKERGKEGRRGRRKGGREGGRKGRREGGKEGRERRKEGKMDVFTSSWHLILTRPSCIYMLGKGRHNLSPNLMLVKKLSS